MDRRAGGIVMLVLVLLAAAVVPNIAAKVIAGTPVASPVPGPPAVGSCVTNVPPASLFGDSGSKYLILPAMQYGSCADGHYGEITAVLPDLPLQTNPLSNGPGASSADGTDGTGNARTDDTGSELLDRCPTQALVYLGLADPTPGNAADPAAWTPALNGSFVFAGPDARQKAAGQKWGACVLVAVAGQYNQAAVRFTGPLQGAVTSGHLPALFGYCAADLSITSASEPCDDWHTYQILGQADLTTSDTSAAARLAGCRTLALRTTRMPDPTAGGRLRLEVVTDRVGADGAASTRTGPLLAGETVYGTCGIRATGTAKLHGSLIGLGTAPVPLG